MRHRNFSDVTILYVILFILFYHFIYLYFTLFILFIFYFIHVYYIVYHYTSTCMYTGLATVVVFFTGGGHCECLASLVGPVHVLSAVMFL